MCMHGEREMWAVSLALRTPDGLDAGAETIRLCDHCMADLATTLATRGRPVLPESWARPRAAITPSERAQRREATLVCRREQDAERDRLGAIAYERRAAGDTWHRIKTDLDLRSTRYAQYVATRWREEHDAPPLPRTGGRDAYTRALRSMAG